MENEKKEKQPEQGDILYIQIFLCMIIPCLIWLGIQEVEEWSLLWRPATLFYKNVVLTVEDFLVKEDFFLVLVFVALALIIAFKLNGSAMIPFERPQKAHEAHEIDTGRQRKIDTGRKNTWNLHQADTKPSQNRNQTIQEL